MSGRVQKLLKDLTGEKAWLAALGLILFGSALRLLFLEQLPYGLNQDEASAGYDAWALLRSGMDRNGKSWPVLFVSWGSGQNVLMSYLTMPFISLLGLRPLSIRLPNAIAGCISLYAMWNLACRCRGKRFGLCALFLLVINPWHIMASRWALESNLLPALLLGACCFLSAAEKKPKALIGAAICLGFAPYAYGTVFFLLPPFLIWAAIRLRKSLQLKAALPALLIFVVLIFPVALCQAINILDGQELQFLGVTIPRLVDARQNATSILGGGGLSAIKSNLMTLLDILHNGDDGTGYNALPFWRGGILYFFGLPLAALGMIVSWKEGRRFRQEWPMLAMLCCGILCSLLIRGNVNRLNMLWLPMIYFSALGASWLIRNLKIRSLLPLAGAALCFLFFGYQYIQELAAPTHGFYPGLGEAIEAAEKMSPDTLYLPMEKIRQPYIYALFYTTPLPEEYLASAEMESGGEEVDNMLIIKRFKGFEFVDPEKADLLILEQNLAEEQGKEILDRYGIYAVCR